MKAPRPNVPQAVRDHFSELCRRGRRLCTAVQAETSRKNGRRGGRPHGKKDSKPRKTPVRKRRV